MSSSSSSSLQHDSNVPSPLIRIPAALHTSSMHAKKKPNQLTPRNDLPVPQISPATVHEKPNMKRRHHSGTGGRVKVSGWTNLSSNKDESPPSLFR